MTTFNTDQWMILALVFVLGLLIGMWLTSGGRRKWKARHAEEVERRRTLEKTHQERVAHWTTREKELREEDTLRASAVRDRPVEVIRERPVDPDYRDPSYRDGDIDPRDRR